MTDAEIKAYMTALVAEQSRAMHAAMLEQTRALRGVLVTRPGQLSEWGKTKNTVTLQAGMGGGKLLLWPEAGKDPPVESVMLQVSYEVLPPFAPTDEIDAAFVHLQWGGCGHNADVDLGRAFPVTLGGDALVVVPQYPMITPADPLRTQPPIRIKASIGIPGEKPAPGVSSSARRTLRFDSIPEQGGSTNVLEIPPWAVTATLVDNSLANPMLEFRQFLANGGTTISIALLGKPDTATIPIAHGARFCALFAPGLVTTPRVMFHLGI